jgi:molecular chaperone DnaK (HSP70)
MSSEKILGIDLGTTNSGMSVVERGEPQMLQNNAGKRLTPSVVHYDDEGKALVGRRAIDREPAEPSQVIREIKRHMGEDDYTVEVKQQEYTPPEVSAEILEKLKRDAEEYLDEEVVKAVVTVPAYFTIDQTAATKQAAEAAGFEETHIVNEPTAAALAYGTGKNLEETILVYDFGGGTLDISVIDIADDEYDVLATDGDNELGGGDFDRALMELIANRYEEEYGVDILDDLEVRANLRAEAEETKIDLSSDETAEALAPFLGQVDGEIISVEQEITRETFEDAVDDLLERAIKPVDDAVDTAGLSAADIDTTLLVGGSTQIPAIQERLETHLGIEPTMTIDPDKIVAQGASMYAQREINTGYRCGICGMEFDAILHLNEHYDEIHSSDPDMIECPEPGCDETFRSEDERRKHIATVHGDNDDDITGTGDGITDIINHSLGTELDDNSMSVIIERGTNTPAEGTKMYTTVKDNQTQVRVRVFQGEDDVAAENRQIGEVLLQDIPPRPQGVPQIQVTYQYDEDGTLQVEAVDTESGDEVDGEFDI